MEINLIISLSKSGVMQIFLLVSETKIDDSFLQGQLVIDGFSAPYRLDCNCLSGGLMLFLRKDIPSNLLAIEEKPIKSFYIEIKRT